MRTLEKLKQNGFPELGNDKLSKCIGGMMPETDGTGSFSIYDNTTGCTTKVSWTRTDNPDGSVCRHFETVVSCE